MSFVEHKACLSCTSSDGLSLYYNEDEGGTYSASCFVCGEQWQNNDLVDTPIGIEYDIELSSSNKNKGGKVVKMKQSKPPISQGDLENIKGCTKHDDTSYRNLGKLVNEKYDVLTKYSSDGKPSHRYYPVTFDGGVVGYKGRELPKAFFSKGRNDNSCQLFGQSLYPNGGKRLLLVGGEEDALAAYEMLRLDQLRRSKSHLEPVAVVSPTTGESGCLKQIQANYEWIDTFEEVIVMFDNDEAGRDATKKALKVLPVGKTKVATLPLKDPCDMKIAGRDAEFVRCFYEAKHDCPVGIVGSSGLKDKILKRAQLKKVPLPPFARKLQKQMAGGIPLGYIVNIASASGQGKSTLVNEFIYYWIFNSPYKVGVVSLESDPGEYGELLLSRHMGQKIALLETVQEKMDFLSTETAESAMTELFYTEDGDDRFHVVDHQGSVGEDELKAKCEYLVRGLGCKLLVVDPLTLALSGGANEDVDEFMSWQKKFVDQHQCVFVNVTHVRKNSNNQQANSRGAAISEESIKGSGSIFQVAGANILLMRDKENEDPIVRNTTKIVMSKCRWTGLTGPSGNWYYDNQKHTLYDYEDYFSGQPEFEDTNAIIDQEATLEEAGATIANDGVEFNIA